MWKWASVRPPIRWTISADVSIWATATTCRVEVRPGLFQIRNKGKLTISPPKKVAAQTCQWIRLSRPSQARGETQTAMRMPASHWPPISQAKSPSARR